MQPRILSISGPVNGETFVLGENVTSIGRDSSNQIQLNDISVSRRHCLIERENDEFKITDLNSLNGTFVYDIAAENTVLHHGNKIRIGDHQFLFLIGDEELPAVSSKFRFDEREFKESVNTVRIRLEEAFSLMARDLSALMKISATINSVYNLDELQKRLLEEIFETIPAKRGVILLAEDGDFSSVFALDRFADTENEVAISRTVVQQVIHEGVALLSNDLSVNENLSNAQSIVNAQTQSLLCVPLKFVDKTLGVIYLDTDETQTRFDRDHLQLLTAIASIAVVAIQNVRHIEWLESETRRLREETLLERNMIGESEAMEKVFRFIAKAAPTDSTVLINGESGTGKELAARAIHLNSPRSDKPFVAINCAALTETLLESELFGHEKGAFTGAVSQKKGKFEIANSGTLFLDEIGELNQSLQAKLLRVLQERELERVGSVKPIKIDVRLIAATNRDLEAEVKAGNFRQDLYYRLNVVQFTMPPLRERKEDIPLLADYFLQKLSAKIGRRVRGLSTATKKLLMKYDWEGNVRELENTIERAVVLGSTDLILPEDLPESILETETESIIDASTQSSEFNYHETINETKKRLIKNAVREAKGSYIEAAKILGVHPNYLHRLIRNLNLKSELTQE